MKALSSAPPNTVAAPVARKASSKAPAKAPRPSVEELSEILRQTLDDAKAEDIHLLNLSGKTSLADFMIIASGGSDRHVNALAERILGKLRELRFKAPRVEGMPVCDWVLIDTGDIILHLFRPEVRGFYNLEKLWGLARPLEGAAEEEDVPKKAAASRTKAE